MSRIGRLPIGVPKDVKILQKNGKIVINGPLGELEYSLLEGISVQQKNENLIVKRKEDSKQLRAYHGLTRALIQNMVIGVSVGYKKELQIVGVGYGAELIGKWIKLNLGFSHEVYVEIPSNLKVEIVPLVKGRKSGGLNVVSQICIKGISKEDVGKFTAEIRNIRPPENYKGKGIRYLGEYVKIKPGKKVASQ